MTPSPTSTPRGAQPSSLPWTLALLGVIVGLEALALGIWTGWFALGFFTDTPDSVGGAIVIMVLSIAATVWLALAASGILRARRWTWAATLVWQLCQVAIAAGAFQGLFAPSDAGVSATGPIVGTVLLVPALVAGVLLFTPGVVSALRRDPR